MEVIKASATNEREAKFDSKSSPHENPEAKTKEVARFEKSLQELKDLRSQLHYAADYCENTFLKSKQKKMVMENTKEYLKRAMVTVVDHLGSVSANLESRISVCKGFSDSELRINCLNQRLLTGQQFAETLNFTKIRWSENFPRHHPRYISLPIQSLEKSNTNLRNVDNKIVPKSLSKYELIAEEGRPITLDRNGHRSSPAKRLALDNGVKKASSTLTTSGFGLSAILPPRDGQSLPSKSRNPSFHFQETKKLQRNKQNRRSPLQILRRNK